MQTTHNEARRLIQFRADGRLDPVNEERLRTHLASCAECRTYIGSVKETESVLRQVLRKQWAARPLPLRMDVVLGEARFRRGAITFLTTRTALVGIVSMLFAFLAWQSVTAIPTPSQDPPATAALIPTPSVPYQFTATGTTRDNCEEIHYLVRDSDTLESIARQFSVSTETLRSANDLTVTSVHPNQELVIPACAATPTGTIRPPAGTITPQLGTISTTPG